MAGNEIMLRPDIRSEAEVREAQAKIRTFLRESVWLFVVSVATLATGAYFGASSGDWTKGLFTIPLGVVILGGLSFIAFRFRHIRHVETRFAIADKGLRVGRMVVPIGRRMASGGVGRTDGGGHRAPAARRRDATNPGELLRLGGADGGAFEAHASIIIASLLGPGDYDGFPSCIGGVPNGFLKSALARLRLFAAKMANRQLAQIRGVRGIRSRGIRFGSALEGRCFGQTLAGHLRTRASADRERTGRPRSGVVTRRSGWA